MEALGQVKGPQKDTTTKGNVWSGLDLKLEKCERHYWDNWWNLNIDFEYRSIVSVTVFLNLIIVLWFSKRMSLFLGDTL